MNSSDTPECKLQFLLAYQEELVGIVKFHYVLFCNDSHLLKLPSMDQAHLQPACSSLTLGLRPNPEKAENENAFLGCCKQVYFTLMFYTSYCVTTDRFFWVKLLALRRTGMV